MTVPIPTLRERELQTRREAMLDAAFLLLSEDGYSGLKMAVLASRLDIAKGTLYQQYPSKDELVVQVIAQRIGLMADLLGPHHVDESALARLERVMTTRIEGRIGLLSPLVVGVPAQLLNDPRCQEQQRRLNAVLTGLIDQARDTGQLGSELPTAALARLALVLLLGDYHGLFEHGVCTPAEFVRSLLVVFRGPSGPDD